MDPLLLTIIITIIGMIIVIDLYKRQNARITSNLHADNLKELLTIAALEHTIATGVQMDEASQQVAANEITLLVDRYERGEIPADAFQHQMDYLLNKH